MNQTIIDRIDALNRAASGYREGELARRLQSATEALELATEHQYLPALAKAHHSRGAILRLLKRPDAAIADLQSATSLFEQLEDHQGLALSFSELGNVYLDLAVYQKALEYLIYSQHEYIRAKNELGVAGSLMNIGNLYSRLGQHEKSIEHYSESLKHHQKLANDRGVARARGNIGLSHLLTGDTRKALIYMEQALPVLEAQGLFLDQCLALCTIGEIHLTDTNYALAESFLAKSHALATEHQFLRAFVSINYHIGRLALAEGRCAEAQAELEQGFELCSEFGASEMKMKYLTALSQLHESCGDYARALQYQREYSLLHSGMLRDQYNAAMEVREATIRSEQEEIERTWLESKNLELENANLELARLNEHKDEILRIVSHDMRTPLGTIIGMGNLLRTEGLDTIEDARSFGALIEDSGSRLLALVEDLLDLSRSEGGAFRLETTATNMHELLTNTVRIFEPLAIRKNVSLKVDSAISLPEVVVDGPKMGQVIGNVLSNALKFTHSGGCVSVSIERSAEDNLRICVRDNGIGMPPEFLDKVFEKFGKHQRPGTNGERGTGLGMPIVKHFVELHRGRVTISSEVDKGTTVNIDLPLAA